MIKFLKVFWSFGALTAKALQVRTQIQCLNSKNNKITFSLQISLAGMIFICNENYFDNHTGKALFFAIGFCGNSCGLFLIRLFKEIFLITALF